MENYRRAQAELCLEMARHLSDPIAAGLMRTAAARHVEQAAELEGLSTAPPGVLRGDDNRRDDFSDSFYYRAIRTHIGERPKKNYRSMIRRLSIRYLTRPLI